ncbi:MAG: hypothetical protein F9K46_01490, partial [Anaerolineae bacterium]
MSPNVVTLYGLLSYALAAILGLSVMFIALWQNARARLNQYLAISMGMLAGWAFFTSLTYVGQFLELDGQDLVHITTSFYMLAIAGLFFFITEFESENRRRLVEGRMLVLFWLMVILGTTWGNE